MTVKGNMISYKCASERNKQQNTQRDSKRKHDKQKIDNKRKHDKQTA